MPRRHEPVAAVVAGTGDNHDAVSERMALHDRISNRAPAASIKSMPAMPTAVAKRSASPISALVSNSIMAPDSTGRSGGRQCTAMGRSCNFGAGSVS